MAKFKSTNTESASFKLMLFVWDGMCTGVPRTGFCEAEASQPSMLQINALNCTTFV